MQLTGGELENHPGSVAGAHRQPMAIGSGPRLHPDTPAVPTSGLHQLLDVALDKVLARPVRLGLLDSCLLGVMQPSQLIIK